MPRLLRIELPTGAWAEVAVDERFATTLAAAAAVDVDDPWIVAVAEAVDRESAWSGRYGAQLRAELTVKAGLPEMFHTTSRRNRSSIATH